MSQESTSQIVSRYKTIVRTILDRVKINKPTYLELYSEFDELWINEDFMGLPMYAKKEIWNFSNECRARLLYDHTVFLYNLDDGIRTITAPDEPHRNNKGTLYWYEVKEICSNDGTMVITKTPTDKVYEAY